MPPGSRPGSGNISAAQQPRSEKNPYEKELDRIEDLLEEMYVTEEQYVKNDSEAGELVFSGADYHFRCTSGSALRYRELVPRIRIPF